MKPKITKTLLLIVVAISLVTAGVVSADHYNNNKNKQARQSEIVGKMQDNAVKELRAKNADITSKYNLLRVECEKGLNAYSNLPTFTKSKIATPTCGPAVL